MIAFPAPTIAAALFLLLSLPSAFSLSNDEFRPRSVYQLLTDRFALPSGASSTCESSPRVYCGGTYTGIVDKLDYIQGMGFDTIWISPIVENINGTTGYGEAYHGYWTQDPNKLNPHFGSENDLKALSVALHKRGMYLMVDIVVNHVASTYGSDFSPSADYGPFTDMSDYHPFCWISDYNNQSNVENCWLGDSTVALPDVNTQKPSVKEFWYSWIADLVKEYNIDALRVDTVKHVQMDFWPEFVGSSGVYNLGEVLEGDPAYVGPYQKEGKTNPFNYPVYFDIINAFKATGGDLSALVNQVSAVKAAFTDPTLLGMFVSNHDNPRFESYTQDQALRKNANAYAMIGDGVPVVYYGTEAGFSGGSDPNNREPFWPSGYNTDSDMYKFFQSLNDARAAAGAASSSFYTNQMSISTLSSNELLIVKGPLVSVLSNRGSSSSTSLTLQSSSTSFPGSTTIVDAVSCETFETHSNGNLDITISDGLPRVFIEQEKMGKVCPGGTQPSTSNAEIKSSLKAGRVAVVVVVVLTILTFGLS